MPQRDRSSGRTHALHMQLGAGEGSDGRAGKRTGKSKRRPAPAGVWPEPTVRERPSVHRHRIQRTGDIRNTAMQKLAMQAKHRADEPAEMHQVTPFTSFLDFSFQAYGMLRQLSKTKSANKAAPAQCTLGQTYVGSRKGCI